jgi:hypothetical protein
MYFNKKYSRVGHLFQERFKSEAVDDEAYLLTVMKYIHNNPVNAGICCTPDGYYWSSYPYYIDSEEQRTFVDTEFILDILSGDRKTAAKEFISISAKPVETEVFDIPQEQETVRPINGKAAAKDYINEFLICHNTSLEDIRNHKGCIRNSLKHELITVLKRDTSLSCRQIGELVGAGKSIVSRL